LQILAFLASLLFLSASVKRENKNDDPTVRNKIKRAGFPKKKMLLLKLILIRCFQKNKSAGLDG